MKDAKVLFNWAYQNGESRIMDRILVSIAPTLIKEDMRLTVEDINKQSKVNVSSRIYNLIKEKAEEFVGSSFKG